MKHFLSSFLLLVICSLAGCTALRQPLDATITPDGITATQSPIQSVTVTTEENPTLAPEPVESPTTIHAPTPECETHQAALQLIPSDDSLRVGETLILTATLANSGCAMIGLPLYRLNVEPVGDEFVLQLAEPETVLHSLGLNDGQQDTAQFTMQAVTPGSVGLQATVSFEVHLGYPGPAYWGTAASEQVRVQVKP